MSCHTGHKDAHYIVPNCHNQSIWDFNGGTEKPIEDIIKEIKYDLTANGIQRDFAVLGGEPMCAENLNNTNRIIKEIREAFPAITIYLWSGYTYEELVKNPIAKDTLDQVNYLIDGPYIDSLRDITLRLRGSSNQRVWKGSKGVFANITNLLYN